MSQGADTVQKSSQPNDMISPNSADRPRTSVLCCVELDVCAYIIDEHRLGEF